MPPPKQPSDDFRAFQLIDRALELEPHEREPFLRREAAGDRELFERALTMLREAEAMPSDPEPAAPEPLRLVTATASAELLKRLMDSARLDETRYEIKDMIGAGGMGRVFLVEDRNLKRSLAMKVPHAVSATDPERRPHASVHLGRFLEEAQVTSQLDHPGVVPVHDLGIDKAGQVYFLMRRVTGDTARDAFAKAREGRDGWTIPRALEVVLKVCDTMAYAHQKGVLHRDLKPDNIRVGAFGEVYVLDWGLAKVGQQADRHDLRVAVAPVASDREIDAQANSESSVVTMDGTTVGTPFYMSPEQALNRPLDQRTDIYAIGATLYELLTGKPPYDEVDIRPQQVLEKVRKGLPTPIERLVANVPAELVAIVEKAMARDPDDRYPAPLDLAADLRAYLEQRVVSAYRTGALVELRMWVRRNKWIAASTAVAVLSVAVVVVALSVSSRTNAALAMRLAAKVDDFDLLAWSAQIDRALDQSRRLTWTPGVDELNQWLEKMCDPVLAKGTAVDGVVARLQPTQPRHRDPALHPRYQEWKEQVEMVESLERAAALRTGQLAFVAATPATLHQDADALSLAVSAWCRTAPTIEERSIWGEEAQGLAFAEAALGRAIGAQKESASYCRSVLAWALVANGRDEDARRCAATWLEEVKRESPEQAEAGYKRIVEAIDSSAAGLATAKAECERLHALVHSEVEWSSEGGAEMVLVERLVEGRRRLTELKAARRSVVLRRDWTLRMRQLTLSHPNARVSWADVREQIRSDPLYASQKIELKDEDVIGIVPLGRNPRTGYFEFYDLRSAWDGAVEHPLDPAALPIPVHRDDGSIEISEASGIVFVLLPGGFVTLGSQQRDANAPFHDEQRADDEAMHCVRLDPFFLSKYEVTIAQWARLWIGDESLRNPSLSTESAIHPVDRVSWQACDVMLTSAGMVLPTEAQWEYACRAGTTTPWAFPAQLWRFANLADATGKNAYGFDAEAWSDEHAGPAPVGSFEGNAFGLHDMHGNVHEWCRDEGSYYGTEREGDGLRTGPGKGRSYRGGAYNTRAEFARSACRLNFDPETPQPQLGLRAARRLVQRP